jgi:hypothetical protein
MSTNTFSVKTVLKEYNCKDEDELAKKLDEDWMNIICAGCHRPLNIGKAKFVDGDPYHPSCV